MGGLSLRVRCVTFARGAYLNEKDTLIHIYIQRSPDSAQLLGGHVQPAYAGYTQHCYSFRKIHY
jgi:hypothetical protein